MIFNYCKGLGIYDSESGSDLSDNEVVNGADSDQELRVSHCFYKVFNCIHLLDFLSSLMKLCSNVNFDLVSHYC